MTSPDTFIRPLSCRALGLGEGTININVLVPTIASDRSSSLSSLLAVLNLTSPSEPVPSLFVCMEHHK